MPVTSKLLDQSSASPTTMKDLAGVMIAFTDHHPPNVYWNVDVTSFMLKIVIENPSDEEKTCDNPRTLINYLGCYRGCDWVYNVYSGHSDRVINIGPKQKLTVVYELPREYHATSEFGFLDSKCLDVYYRLIFNKDEKYFKNTSPEIKLVHLELTIKTETIK